MVHSVTLLTSDYCSRRVSFVLPIFLTVIVAALAWRLQQERRRRKEFFMTATWPIVSIDLEALDSAFSSGPFRPSVQTEVAFVGRGQSLFPGAQAMRKRNSFVEFIYTGTAAADAITQLYGDSKQFDETPWRDWADIVFVDWSHAQSYRRK